jgi:putative transcriptional regulator
VSSDFDTLRGQLLVAAPALVDPNFRRTVVLVTEHSEEGAMGVVLNRATPVAVSEAVPHLGELAGDDAVVYVGGPVQPEAVVALAEFEDPAQAASIAFEAVGYVRAEAEPGELHGAVGRLRVFAGYAGWTAGQLDAELEESAWIVEPALVDDVFSDSPETLWSDVLRRKGGEFRIMATMPDDPSLN